MRAHAEFLRIVTLDGDLKAALLHDYRTASLDPVDRAIADYVVALTRDATSITQQNHERLREVGFDDTGILQITLIGAWFNYINRVADALGVGRSSDVAPLPMETSA